jgi:hypothetical protein
MYSTCGVTIVTNGPNGISSKTSEKDRINREVN